MTAPMPAITVYQPHASLIVLGIKRWEMRPSPPNGDMRPAGVRGLPGLRINRGDRIAIHAAATRPRNFEHRDADTDVPPWIDLAAMSSCWDWWEHPDQFMHGGMYRWCGPLGAIVGLVTVVDVLPITDVDEMTHDDIMAAATGLYPCIGVDGSELIVNGTVDISDQLPYGDWTPGRWAWALADIEPCDPIPAKGKQGVWTWTP